jgi:hypothetical protein
MTNDDSKINISCKHIVFLQDFANFKTFLRAKNRVKTSKRMKQSRRCNEGKFVLMLMFVCFIITTTLDILQENINIFSRFIFRRMQIFLSKFYR